MEEIDINQLLSYFKSKVIYILFAMSIAFCLSSIYVNRFRVPEYTSSTTILLNQANDSVQISTNDITLNKSLVTTYGEIIKSKRVIRQAIENLSLETSYPELSNMVSVGEIPDTSIIRISVTNKDSALAAEIANAIAEVFSKEIVEIYNIENISIIDKAEEADRPSSASTLKIIGVSTLVGAFISIVSIFIAFYFDTTVKNEEDVERITGLPVIGLVPMSREKIKTSAHRKYHEELAKKHIQSSSNEVQPIEKKIDANYVHHNVEKEVPLKEEKSLPATSKENEEIKKEQTNIYETNQTPNVEKIEEDVEVEQIIAEMNKMGETLQKETIKRDSELEEAQQFIENLLGDQRLQNTAEINTQEIKQEELNKNNTYSNNYKKKKKSNNNKTYNQQKKKNQR